MDGWVVAVRGAAVWAAAMAITGIRPALSDAIDSAVTGGGGGASPAAAASSASCRLTSLRRSSLTSERKRSGVMRESSARTRSSSDGCVENHEPPNLLAHAGSLLAMNMCATPEAPSCSRRVPAWFAAMVMNALCSACGLRVNCTADASARCSRRRDTAACSRRPATMPTLPAMNTPNAMALSRAGVLAPAAAAHQAQREIGDDPQTEDPRRQAHVDLHVAVEDVAELVTDDRLHLLAAECVERALRDGHRRLVR